MKIVADDKIPYLKGVLEPFAEMIYKPGHLINRNDLIDADVLITRTRTICNEELLHDTKVKMILTATIGYDHIDTDYCDKKRIIWKNAPGCNSGSVMQYIGSALVSLSRKHIFELKDKTIGIVGIGNVGSKVSKLANLLGMKVLLNDPPRVRKEKLKGFVSIDTIIKEADIITLHVPLNKGGEDKTWHLFDEAKIKQCKAVVIIINSSRGEVVDGQALKNALKQKTIKGAVLDVWENEPNIDTELMGLLDIATPHIAGYSADGKANGTAMSVQVISRHFNLGFDNWFPEKIPEPTSSVITIDCKNKTSNQIVEEAIYSTYNITSDDNRLRQSVLTFEKQRGDYPLRREYQAYKLKLKNSNQEINESLNKIGFKIIS